MLELDRLREIRRVYEKAAERYDINAMAELMLLAGDYMVKPRNGEEKEEQLFFHLRATVVFAGMLRALEEGRAADALRFMDWYQERAYGKASAFFYYEALAYYAMGEWEKAADKLLAFGLQDEEASFYFGNACFRLGRYGEAVEAYRRTLSLRQSFFEAEINAHLAARRGDLPRLTPPHTPEVQRGVVAGKLWETPTASSLWLPSGTGWQDIPVFINSRDRLIPLQRLLPWLLRAGFRRVYILDNASTYPPLLEYYNSLHGCAEVIVLGENLGYQAIWRSGILERMAIRTPYIYTDSDVVPADSCPAAVVERLLEVLGRYPLLCKAGLSLRCSDITYFEAKEMRQRQELMRFVRMEPDCFFQEVDTTFALYRNKRHYSLVEAAALASPAELLHLPWYYDYKDLPEDEAYYMAHADVSSTIVQAWGDRGTKG